MAQILNAAVRPSITDIVLIINNYSTKLMVMIEKIFICLAGTILTSLFNPTFSQTNQDLSNELSLSSKEESSHSPIVSTGYLNDISPRAIRSFIRRFDYAPGETWQKVTNGYIAYFEKDSIKFKVSYDAGGTWVNTMRTYTEKYLPFTVRHAVKRIYYDFNICLVTEVESDDQPLIYLIDLMEIANEASLKKIMYNEGEMLELDLSKGKWWQRSLTPFPKKQQ